MMAWVGCHIDAYEQAKWFGDDCAVKHDIRSVDFGRPVESAAFVIRHIGSGRRMAERARLGAAFLGDGVKAMDAMLDNHWRAADQLAERLGLGDVVRANIAQTFERWDGKGDPGEVKGGDILVASRLVNLADVVEVFHEAGGVDAAVGVAKARRGTQFDPELVDLFCARASELFDELETGDQLGRTDGPPANVAGALSVGDLDAALEAIGDFVDLKAPFAIGHARNVADLAAGAGAEVSLPAPDLQLLRRAALVHDVGQLGVPNSIWDKRGPLSASGDGARPTPPVLRRPDVRVESARASRQARCRAPRATRRLRLSPWLDRLGLVVGEQGPRRRRCLPDQDRGAAASAARLVAGEVESQLRAEVKAGRLDGDAVNAVLRAAGHRVRRKRGWPAGLTAREVEVLRLVAQGLSHKQIAERLVISRKTASNHVERIYAKIGVNNRAMAGLFAMKHGLMLAHDSDAAERRPDGENLGARLMTFAAPFRTVLLMTTTDSIDSAATPVADIDEAVVEEFAGQLFRLFTGGALTYLIEIGRRTGLFDAAAGQPMTCPQLADRAGLTERYVREWLAAMATSGIFEYDPATGHYWLPREHAICLTRGAADLAPVGALVTELGRHVAAVTDAFRSGGGVPWDAYKPEIHDLMDILWGPLYEEALIDTILPLAPGILERLRAGSPRRRRGLRNRRRGLDPGRGLPPVHVHRLRPRR